MESGVRALGNTLGSPGPPRQTFSGLQRTKSGRRPRRTAPQLFHGSPVPRSGHGDFHDITSRVRKYRTGNDREHPAIGALVTER